MKPQIRLEDIMYEQKPWLNSGLQKVVQNKVKEYDRKRRMHMYLTFIGVEDSSYCTLL
jgi:hypothetical protein